VHSSKRSFEVVAQGLSDLRKEGPPDVEGSSPRSTTTRSIASPNTRKSPRLSSSATFVEPAWLAGPSAGLRTAGGWTPAGPPDDQPPKAGGVAGDLRTEHALTHDRLLEQGDVGSGGRWSAGLFGLLLGCLWSS